MIGQGVGGQWPEIDVLFSRVNPKGVMAEGMVDAGELRAVSVGFRSLERAMGKRNEPLRHTRKELLEVSIVPIPANPEAVRVRSLDGDETIEAKAGRVLSAANEARLKQAVDLLAEVLATIVPGEQQQQIVTEAATAADPAPEVAREDTQSEGLEPLFTALSGVKEALDQWLISTR